MFDALTKPPAARRWSTLVLVASLALHAAAVLTVIVVAMWKIELLVPDRLEVTIGIRRPSIDLGPEPSPAPVPTRDTGGRRRPQPPTVPTQPVAAVAQVDVEPITGATGDVVDDAGDAGGDTTATGDGTCLTPPCGGGGQAAVVDTCGDGAVGGDEQCDDGNQRSGDGCSPACRRETPAQVNAAPTVIESLRISGETRVLPPPEVQTQMVRTGVSRARGVARICLDTSGRVEEARFLRSTGFASYDQRLLASISGWRYRPYSVNGQVVAVCGTVEFVYVQQ